MAIDEDPYEPFTNSHPDDRTADLLGRVALQGFASGREGTLPLMRMQHRITHSAYGEATRLFDMGIVEDNRDPDKQGRVKVRLPLATAGGLVTGWIHTLSSWRADKAGVWCLPSVGDNVVVAYPMGAKHQPVVVGCFWNQRVPPPFPITADGSVRIKTKNGIEVTINEEEGNERIELSMKNGKMRAVISNKGIQIVNELGDIEIKARKVTFEAGDALFKAKGKLKVEAGTDLGIKAAKKLALASKNGELVLKGRTVAIKGSGGVTTGGRQLAKEEDPVVGVDLHDINVPSPSGVTPVPAIPHPYVGKLANALSNDVKINGKAAAVKGSKSSASPGHFPIGGVSFVKPPSNEGEVSSGTAPKVKINGKEAALVGSMVKTCGDPQAQETCSIFTFGALVPIPFMPPGFDPEQYRRDGGFLVNTMQPEAPPGAKNSLTDDRELSNPQWGAESVKVGEEATLTVNYRSKQDKDTVCYFAIYPEGADPDVDRPIAEVRGMTEDGKAEGKWRLGKGDFPEPAGDPELAEYYERNGMDCMGKYFEYRIGSVNDEFDNPVRKSAKFFFVVWAFRCGKVRSGLVSVGADIDIMIMGADGNVAKDVDLEIVLADGSSLTGRTDSDGVYAKRGVIPGLFQVKVGKKPNG